MSALFFLLQLLTLRLTCSFQPIASFSSSVQARGRAHELKETMSDVDEYRNGVTQFLSNFMQKDEETQSDQLSDIDFNAPKARKMSLEELASVLDRELYEKEWFVTGRVNPVYFDDGFQFQDPDVKLTGVEGKNSAL